MHEEWTDLLSDYLDGELPAGERAAVESHLAGCVQCTKVLEDLKLVIARARSIQPRPPQADLWQGIAERIEARSPGVPGSNLTRLPAPAMPQARGVGSRRISFSLPELAAAAVLLMAISGGAVWSIIGRSAHPPVERTASVERPAASTESETPPERRDRVQGDDVQMATIGFADQQYDAAVSDLEKALHKGRGHLDANTIAIVEHNLQIIDQAIAQARQALAADPANSYLSGHLVEARRRKLDLLRRAAALTGETD